jgi:hypothetical protein
MFTFFQLIPPKEWVARASGYDNLDLVIPAPIKQEALSGSKGIFKILNIARKSMTVQEYKQLANSSRYYNRLITVAIIFCHSSQWQKVLRFTYGWYATLTLVIIDCSLSRIYTRILMMRVKPKDSEWLLFIQL